MSAGTAAARSSCYVMIYEMFIDDTPMSDLQDCGRLVRFFESTDFDTMAPHDELKNGSTDYVLANPGCSYIAYASGTTTTIGLKNMSSGTYSFKWFDCKDGKGGGHELEQPVPARNFFLNDGTGKFTRADLGVPYTGFTQGAPPAASGQTYGCTAAVTWAIRITCAATDKPSIRGHTWFNIRPYYTLDWEKRRQWMCAWRCPAENSSSVRICPAGN